MHSQTENGAEVCWRQLMSRCWFAAQMWMNLMGITHRWWIANTGRNNGLWKLLSNHLQREILTFWCCTPHLKANVVGCQPTFVHQRTKQNCCTRNTQKLDSFLVIMKYVLQNTSCSLLKRFCTICQVVGKFGGSWRKRKQKQTSPEVSIFAVGHGPAVRKSVSCIWPCIQSPPRNRSHGRNSPAGVRLSQNNPWQPRKSYHVMRQLCAAGY